MKKGLKASLALLAIAAITTPMAVKVNAANNYIPELNVYQQGASPKIEIGVDMPDEDVIFKSDFNTNKPSLLWNGSGTQSFSTYDGRNVLMMTDSKTNSSGNYYSYPSTESTINFSSFSLMKYPREEWFSVSYEVKALSNNNEVYFFAHGGHRCKGYNTYDIDGKQVYWTNNTNFKNASKGDSFKVKLADGSAPNFRDGSTVVLVSSDDEQWGFYYIYFTYNRSTSSFIYDNGPFASDVWEGDRNKLTYSTFPAGSPVLCLNSYSTESHFENRNIPADGNWHRISNNSIITCYDWDTNVNGFRPAFTWSSNNNMYISNVKFGKASKVQVMRDNSTTVYNDYGSEFTDSYHVTPNNPNVISATTNATDVTFNFKADAKSETHTYKARSLGSSGNKPSAWSKEYPVTLTSTPVGYSVKVDKNANTDPGTAKNNTDGQISVSGYREGDIVYCHIRTVDQNGKWSAPIHYKYTVQQTALDLKEDCNSFADKLSVSNTTDINSVKSQISALRTNTNIPYNITKIDKSNATKYVKGKLETTTTVNGQAQAFTTPIENKPEYQTEQELKEDITDYVGQTKIHVDKKQLIDKLTYEASKETETIEKDINEKCKTNPDLKDITIEFNNTATEFKSGKLEGTIYLED